MKLVDALGLSSDVRLALVGAGGKTSALFRIGREMLSAGGASSQVWLSVSTHLGVEQLVYADHSVEINNPKDLRSFFKAGLPGICLLHGERVHEERVSGLSPEMLDELKRQADLDDIPILIEADGSKRLPLKAPAGHEPVIPGWCSQVVVVAGLSGLGKPLSSDWVHRPQLFSLLSCLTVGEVITKEALLSVLAHPLGGLKDIPYRTKRILMLNQVNSAEKKIDGEWLAARLAGKYHRIILADLARPVGEGEILEVFEAE